MFDDNISLDMRVLSALLNHESCVISASEIDKIPDDYFDTEDYRKMYHNIMSHFENYKNKSKDNTILTPDIMKQKMLHKKMPSIEVARVYSMYSSVASVGTTANEYPFYVEMLKQRAYKKMLVKAVNEASSVCMKENKPVEAADTLLKTASQIKMLSSNDRIVRTSIHESANDIKDRYLFAKNRKEEAMGLYTGFYQLDNLTWGIHPGEVLIVAGPTGGGKSVTLVAMAAYIYNGLRFCNHCSFQLFRHSQICPACGADMSQSDSTYNIRGKNVAYVSIEMPEEDCMRRFLSSSLGLSSKDIQRGRLGVSDEKLYFDFLQKVAENKSPGFYMIDVPRGVDADFIDSELDRIESTNGIKLDVVIIDYMQLMTPKGSRGPVKEGDWREQGAIAAEVHELARNRRIPVISAVQTTSVRSLKNEQMRYGTHRVARAEDIANNVNIIIQIEDIIEDDKKKGDQASEDTMAITYHVIKNRDGAKGVIQMQKDFSRMQIYHMVEYKYEQAEH